jgi:phosphonate degradation associated HDIG domain protein
MSFFDEIRAAFDRRGRESYGEGVTQLEHALQAAWLAERAGAPASMIAAALLHDIGHMLHELPEDIAEQGIDAQHESIGSAWLSRHFGAEVSEPVRLHVEAKRYLAAAEPGYFDRLSEASKLSLRLQGGPFAPDGMQAFLRRPYAREAMQLRRWDDEAKVAGRSTPGLEHFEPALAAGARSAGLR